MFLCCKTKVLKNILWCIWVLKKAQIFPYLIGLGYEIKINYSML